MTDNGHIVYNTTRMKCRPCDCVSNSFGGSQSCRTPAVKTLVVRLRGNARTASFPLKFIAHRINFQAGLFGILTGSRFIESQESWHAAPNADDYILWNLNATWSRKEQFHLFECVVCFSSFDSLSQSRHAAVLFAVGNTRRWNTFGSAGSQTGFIIYAVSYKLLFLYHSSMRHRPRTQHKSQPVVKNSPCRESLTLVSNVSFVRFDARNNSLSWPIQSASNSVA